MAVYTDTKSSGVFRRRWSYEVVRQRNLVKLPGAVTAARHPNPVTTSIRRQLRYQLIR